MAPDEARDLKRIRALAEMRVIDAVIEGVRGSPRHPDFLCIPVPMRERADGNFD